MSTLERKENKMTPRLIAKAAGMLRYNGLPCNQGHTERYVNSGDCIICKRVKKYKKRDALRKIKREEKQKLKASPEYIEAKRLAKQAYHRKYYITYTKTEAQKEAKREYKKQWRKNSSAMLAEALRRRRAGKVKRTPKWITNEDIWLMREVYCLAAKRTKLHRFIWHVDHIIPLHGKTVSGLHVPNNLQVIPALLNCKKGNKLLIDN